MSPLPDTVRSLAATQERIARGELRRLLGELAGDPEAVLLARALRRHRSVLEQDPSLALPCVYQLGWFASDGSEGPGPLRPLLREWMAQHRGPWLRSLRRPVFPLDAPIEAEVRGVKGPARPWFSADGQVVGLRDQDDEPVAAWERESLEPLEPIGAGAPTRATARYRIATYPELEAAGLSNDTWGKLPLIDIEAGTTRVLPVDDESKLGCLVELAGGDVVAGGWFCDYDGVVVRVRPSDGAVIWRTDLTDYVRSLSVSADGSRVLADGFVVLGSDTGEVLGVYRDDIGKAALSPDNAALAVFSGQALRVWALEDRPWQRLRGTQGLTDAVFSPDGSLLLSGSCLRDGETGAHIATLELESGGYLEGGPAIGCTALVNDGLIEASVFEGVQRWNRRGERTLQDESRRYFNRYALSFDPTGQLYAVGEAFTGSATDVEIRRVDDGALIGTLSDRRSAIAWSSDGRRLASIGPEGDIYVTSVGGKEQRIGSHQAAIETCFSVDGTMLASRSEHEERLWSLSTLELLGERPSTEDLHGWLGFRSRAHDRVGRLERGLFVVSERGRTIARIPSDELLNTSPSGSHWAGSTSHYLLEGDNQ